MASRASDETRVEMLYFAGSVGDTNVCQVGGEWIQPGTCSVWLAGFAVARDAINDAGRI